MLDAPEAVLQHMFGYENFREGQKEAIQSLLENKDTIVVIPTGGGKTVIYTVACVMRRGISVVLSPLVMLMYDQVARLRQLGINTCYYNTLIPDNERKFVIHNLQLSECQFEFVFVSPEGALTEPFLNCLRKLNDSKRLNFIIVDEAHCINSWGRHFRKAYGQLGQLKDLFGVPFAALTGTASKVTLEIIKHQLHLPDPTYVKLSCRRSNLCYKIVPKPDTGNAKEFAITYVTQHHSGECGIIYCGTQTRSTEMAFLISQKGLTATYYHADLEVEDKKANAKLWLDGNVDIMCCTSAFGMGIDKKDVRFVMHLSMPPSPEDLLQESGRAGRDGELAKCTVLYSFSDRSVHLQRISKIESTAVQDDEIRLLNEITSMLSNRLTCRQQLFSKYFEQDEKEPCELCDNCQRVTLPTQQETDMTIEAQELITCLQQMMLLKPKVKLGDLVMTYIGSRAKEILDSQFNSCGLYGKGKNKFKTARKLTKFVEHLIYQNVFKENFQSIREGRYIVYLTSDKAFEVMSGVKKVTYLHV